MKTLKYDDINWKKSVIEDAKDFKIYRKNSSKALTTYDEVIKNHYEVDSNMTPSDWWDNRVEELISERVSAMSSVSNNSDHQDMNNYTAELLSFLRFTYAEPENNASRLVILLPDNTGKCLLCEEGSQGYGKLVDNIMSSMVQAGVSKKFSKRFKEGFNDSVANSSKYYKEETLVTPLLKTYLLDNIDVILASEDFFIEDSIKNFSNDSGELAFKQMLNLGESIGAETPTLDSWMSEVLRPDQVVCFRAWLYATTQANCKIRQVAWLLDLHGDTGKSSFLGAFDEWFNSVAPRSTTSFNPKSINSQFGMSQMFGFRLGINADLKNTKILKSSELHSITGGDNVSVERKGQQPFKAKMFSMFLLASNDVPSINMNNQHEVSRLLYLPMKAMSDEYLKTQCTVNEDGSLFRDYRGAVEWRADSNFDELILSEMGDFIKNSEPYFKALRTRNSIKTSIRMIQDMQDSLVDEVADEVEAFVETHLVIKEDAYMTNSEFRELLKNEENKDTVKEFKGKYSSPEEVIRKYIESKHKIKFKQFKLNGVRIRGAKGVGIVNGADLQVPINQLRAIEEIDDIEFWNTVDSNKVETPVASKLPKVRKVPLPPIRK